MTTNAQAALQAAATWFGNEKVNARVLLGHADDFKKWLDRQDDKDREARRKQPVPKGAGNTDGVAEARAHGFPVRETMQEHYRSESPSPTMRDTAGLPSAHVLDSPF